MRITVARPGGGRRETGRRSWLRALALVAAASAVVFPMATAAGSARATVLGNALHEGEEMSAGMSLVSHDQQYRLDMQRDGNLVERHGGKVLWESDTGGHPKAHANMQRDGNFVIYAGEKVLFETDTHAVAGTKNDLVVQDDGNVVVYSGAKPLWWSTKPKPLPVLAYGSTGPAVWTLQRRLSALKYWLGPPDGVFADATQQAVWALQKAAGLSPTGVVDAATWSALARGVEAKPRPASGNLIEVDLQNDLLMIIRNGQLWETLNTSTGGGYTYVDNGQVSVAETPTGIFHIFGAIDGTDTDSLGTLWRPRFFYEGYAIHGDGYVPPFPVSHGCVRVSNEAIDWIWAVDAAPIGEEVWVF